MEKRKWFVIISKVMSATKLTIKQVSKMDKGIDAFANVIYNNFFYLTNRPELQHNIDELKRLLRDPNMISFIVYNGDTIVAYLVGEIKNLNDGRVVFYISYIYVGQKYRGSGIGKRLMNLIIAKCKADGLRFILLTCDTDDNKVYQFYQKLGFIPDPILKNNGKHEVMALYL